MPASDAVVRCPLIFTAELTLEAWREKLEEGDAEAAWAAFLDSHRRLVFAAIRHYVHSHDDVMDVFACVCGALRENDFRRLRSYSAEAVQRARFSTWLVAVVRNLTVDWLRKRDGRRRPAAIEAQLTDLQRRIWEETFDNGRSHAEAYEVVRSRSDFELSFGVFLKELAAVHRIVGAGKGRLARELLGPPPADPSAPFVDSIATQEAREILDAALRELPADHRVAVQMYVVDEVPAADVARVLGLPNAKAVYNRVYRSLDTLRTRLETAGLGRGDL